VANVGTGRLAYPDVQMNEQIRAGPTELTWDPIARTATLRFVEEGEGGREEAERLTAQLSTWVGDPDPEPYQLLVDCSSMVDIDAGWRTTWAEYFKDHREHATIAWFNASPWIRLIILLFKKATGIRGEIFGEEAEARRWLETVGHAP
jgi:hypothetical protein